MLDIRKLVLSDCEAVLGINAASVPGVATLDESEFARLMVIPNHHLAAEGANQVVVGYALAFNSNAPYDGEEFGFFQQTMAQPFIYIDQVATQLEFRRTGMGSSIYDAIEKGARLSKASALCCEVNINPPNPVSFAFHRSRGFRQSGTLTTTDGRVVALLAKDVG